MQSYWDKLSGSSETGGSKFLKCLLGHSGQIHQCSCGVVPTVCSSSLEGNCYSRNNHIKRTKIFSVWSSPDQPNFKKIAVRSSPNPAKIEFSPDPADLVLIRAHLCCVYLSALYHDPYSDDWKRWRHKITAQRRATLIVGKKGRREIGKCFPSKFSSLHLMSTLNVRK